jgi:CheY-like chemotaxis protein
MVATVARAHDGNEAMAMVETGEVSPDVALIDLHMPGMSGFELLVAFGARLAPSFPMIVVTSSSSPSDAIRSRLRSAMRVVIKPDTVAELHAVLKTALEAVCRPAANADNKGPDRAPAYELAKARTASVRRPAGDARQG